MAKQSKNVKATSAEPASNRNETVEVVLSKQAKVDEKSAVDEQKIHLIVFKLGGEYYGIKIEQVKEVTITPNITRMPRTPEFVQGVANIRGDIIAIVDLEKRFNIRPMGVSDEFASSASQTYTLVIEAKDYSIGIVVKEVPQSLNLAMSKLDRAPSFLQDTSIKESYIEGIAKVDNRLIIVLDMHKILSADEIKQLTGKSK